MAYWDKIFIDILIHFLRLTDKPNISNKYKMDLFIIVLIPFLFLLFQLIEVNLKYGFNILLYEMKINVRSIIEDEIIRLLELLKGGTECEIIDLADFSRLLNKNDETIIIISDDLKHFLTPNLSHGNKPVYIFISNMLKNAILTCN
jgi:hypothetical protein